MSYTATVTIIGEDGKPFPGDSEKEINKNKDVNDVLSVSYKITKATDVAQGRNTGEMKVMPLIITKEVGPSTPRTLAAVNRNENLQKVLITFYRAQKKGGNVEAYYTIELVGATLQSHHVYTGKQGQDGTQLTSKPAAEHDSMELEELGFTYKELTTKYIQGSFDHGPGNQEATYKWSATHGKG